MDPMNDPQQRQKIQAWYRHANGLERAQTSATLQPLGQAGFSRLVFAGFAGLAQTGCLEKQHPALREGRHVEADSLRIWPGLR